MFGTNQQRPILGGDGSTLEVQSIFRTLQGEGPFSGMPAIFIRLAGCNLACTFCDTDFESAYVRDRPATRTLDEVVEAVMNLNYPGWPGHPAAAESEPVTLVVLTGGEPMRQNVAPLIRRLVTDGLDVQIETAGTIAPLGDIAHLVVAGLVTVVVSPKTFRVNDWYLTNAQHWKYILRADDSHPFDGLPYKSTQVRGAHADKILAPAILRPAGLPGTIWVSPCDEQDPKRNAANVAKAVEVVQKFGYRLSLQVHKIVGVE